MEEKLQLFMSLLQRENLKHNLVSRRAGPEELWRHIEDSRRILSWESFSGSSLVDIGSGAGFPGLILAICCPDSRVSLVESDHKKSLFLACAARELDLDNVTLIRERAEVLGRDPEYREKFDACSSRAVAAMRVVLEYGLPLVRPGGIVWLWKGSGFRQEMEEARNALEQLGGRIDRVYEYDLISRHDRAIVGVKKFRPTPQDYPRKTGIPAKRPL